MPIIRHLEQLPDAARGGAVAIGNFDGVHLGHRRIVERLLQRAADVGGPAIVFTFDPHPAMLLRPTECPPPLTWTERKAALLKEQGVDRIVAFHTDDAFLQLTAREFFERIVVGALAANAMVEGPNFYFGHNREGDIELLRQLTAEQGVLLDVVEPLELDGQLVSSSLIRRLVAGGDVAAAARMLTHPYRIRGMVTHGAGRGATLGFATANLEAIDTLLPAPAVYAGRAWVGGQGYAAAINIGPNPTFGEHGLKVEIHLIDQDVALYGEPLEVEFLARLRDVKPFPSKDALVAQLHQDIDDIRNIVARVSHK